MEDAKQLKNSPPVRSWLQSTTGITGSEFSGLGAAAAKIYRERVHKCAWMLIYARNRVESDVANGRTVPTPDYYSAGLFHGIEDGEEKPDQVTTAYNQGRQACQNIHASCSADLKRLTELIELKEKDLPIHVREEARTFLRAMKRFVICVEPHPDNLLKRTREKEGRECYTDESAALIMWRKHFRSTRQRGYWKDIYTLAQIWSLTITADSDIFRQSVTGMYRRADCLNAARIKERREKAKAFKLMTIYKEDESRPKSKIDLRLQLK